MAGLTVSITNTRLWAENAELKAQIAEQAEKIARLERLISRNSGNSSMPPDTDDLPGKKPPEHMTRQGGMKRKPGKQPARLAVPGLERAPRQDRGRRAPVAGAQPRLRACTRECRVRIRR
jgi:hypothetical protein